DARGLWSRPMEPPVEAVLDSLPTDQPQPIADAAWSDATHLVLSGICMGTADLVPGVSGGTMAVAVGIYRRLLAAIDSVGEAGRVLLTAKARRIPRALAVVHYKFIACLGVGIVAALVIMGKLVGLP